MYAATVFCKYVLYFLCMQQKRVYFYITIAENKNPILTKTENPNPKKIQIQDPLKNQRNPNPKIRIQDPEEKQTVSES